MNPSTWHGENVPRVLALEGVTAMSERETASDTWDGHWIFNTNESYGLAAYQAMFERNVAAIYGYPNGPRNLEGSRQDDIVLAYVNQQGLRTVGCVIDGQVRPGQGIFLDPKGGQHPSEFHLAVRWEAVPLAMALANRSSGLPMGNRHGFIWVCLLNRNSDCQTMPSLSNQCPVRVNALLNGFMNVLDYIGKSFGLLIFPLLGH